MKRPKDREEDPLENLIGRIQTSDEENVIKEGKREGIKCKTKESTPERNEQGD